MRQEMAMRRNIIVDFNHRRLDERSIEHGL